MHSLQRSRNRRCRRRRGYALIIFVLIFWCLLALAALVIDLGFARSTQRQMQTAVDTAALEALRGRDQANLTPQEADTARRSAAASIAAEVFDDDFDLASDARDFGAGPQLAFSDGISLSPEFAASQLMTIADPPVYDPLLQPNLDNKMAGDMVAGTYDGTTAGLAHQEQNDYTRDDFAPLPEGAAFLVRMRRTGEPNVGDVQSSGARLPYLFGRGSLLASDLKGRGIAVRATAIAAAQSAKAIGRSSLADEFPEEHRLAGALALAIYSDVWETFPSDPSDSPQTVSVDSSGALSIAGTPIGYAIHPLGVSRGISLGEGALPQTPVTPDDYIAGLVASVPTGKSYGYAAIIPPAGGGSSLAGYPIGFGYFDFSPGTSTSVLLTKRINRIAPENASAVLARELAPELNNSLNDPEFHELWQRHRDLSGSLLAPALVR